MKTKRSNRLTRLLLALWLCIVIIPMAAGCGKKAPKTPIELPVTEASSEQTIELPVDNGTAAVSVAETAQTEATAASETASTESASADQTSEAQQASGAAAKEATASPEAATDQAQTQSAPEPQPAPEPEPQPEPQPEAQPQTPSIDENGVYTTKDDVALYIHTYGKLPSNFITKKAAKKLGWEGGSLEDYAPGKCIGGDYFGNYEGLLPEGKEYHECDIDTLGKKKRGAKRIIYSDDGYIYYTGDHYESFQLLYEP